MIEKLFTSKNRVKILEFLLFEKNESHIREISREIKISSSAVKKEVDNLLEIGLIVKGEKNIKLNKKCSYLEDLKNIFIKTDAVIYPLREVIEKDKKIKYALLFGSFAKGNYQENSDVDLMVIGDIGLGEVIKLIRPVERVIKKDVNPIVWKLKEFKESNGKGFVREVFSNKIIIIKGDENELRRIIK